MISSSCVTLCLGVGSPSAPAGDVVAQAAVGSIAAASSQGKPAYVQVRAPGAVSTEALVVKLAGLGHLDEIVIL